MVETAFPGQVSNRNVYTTVFDGTFATATDIPLALIVGDQKIVHIEAKILTTAPTDASGIWDVNLNGTTVFTTQANRPTVLTTAFASTTVLPDVTTLTDGDQLEVDVDQVGSTVAGVDWILTVITE